MRRMPVEKYGVDENTDATEFGVKKISDCPRCGSPLRPTAVTGVFLCPKCGSLPFEEKKEEE